MKNIYLCGTFVTYSVHVLSAELFIPRYEKLYFDEKIKINIKLLNGRKLNNCRKNYLKKFLKDQLNRINFI